ncbi:hypothetical protein ACHAXS_000862 [Conticribra weissflogii]
MIEWLNKWCPGWMCVPRKPHPFDNEYHSIADIDDGAPVMWRVDLKEGKDQPREMVAKPIHKSGKIVIMDSGFSVTHGIIAMKDKGIYRQALIKKRGCG